MSFKDELMKLKEEVSAGDIGGVDSKLGAVATRPSVREENMDFLDDDTNYLGLDDYEFNISRDELKDIVKNLSDDELHFVVDVVNDYLSINSDNTSEYDDLSLMAQIDNADDETFIEISEIILYTLEELKQIFDVYNDYGVDNVDERLINPVHTKQLRRARIKPEWKKQAKLRARFRKTGAGKLAKKKAKRYLKRYRTAHKVKLKKYGSEYNKNLKIKK